MPAARRSGIAFSGLSAAKILPPANTSASGVALSPVLAIRARRSRSFIAARCAAPAVAGRDRPRVLLGVVLHVHRDVVEFHPQHAGDDLGEDGAMPLALRHRGDVRRDRSDRINGDRRACRRAVLRSDPRPLPGGERHGDVAHVGDARLDDGRESDAVAASRGAIRERLPRHQVPADDVERVEPERLRDAVPGRSPTSSAKRPRPVSSAASSTRSTARPTRRGKVLGESGGLGMRSAVQGTIGEMVAGNGSGDSPGNDRSSLVRAPTRAEYSFADTDRAVVFPIGLTKSDRLRVLPGIERCVKATMSDGACQRPHPNAAAPQHFHCARYTRSVGGLYSSA